MKEVLEFLENAQTYFLATSNNNKPYVRPFGTINLFEDRLYIQTGKVKTCYKEMINNPFIEISAFYQGKWIRVSAEVVPDDRVIAKKAMLDKYPNLRGMYNEMDSNTIVLYLKNATATIYSFTDSPKVIKF